MKIVEILPNTEGHVPRCDRLEQRGLPHVVRPGNDRMTRQVECQLIESLEIPNDHAPEYHFASFRLLTTISSLPRSSITLTAIWPCSPDSKGTDTLPDKCCHTASSYSPFSERLR